MNINEKEFLETERSVMREGLKKMNEMESEIIDSPIIRGKIIVLLFSLMNLSFALFISLRVFTKHWIHIVSLPGIAILAVFLVMLIARQEN